MVVSRGHGQRSAVPRIRLPGMSLRLVRRAGGGRQTVLWLPASGESACRPAGAPGLRVIRLARRAGRVVPGGVATSGAAAVIAGDRRAGITASSWRVRGCAARWISGCCCGTGWPRRRPGSRRSGAAGPEGAGPLRGGLVPAARPAAGAERLGPGRCCGCAGWQGSVRAMVPGAGSRDRGNAVTGGVVAAVDGVPVPPGPGGNDHGGFRSQFGQQVFEKLVGTAGFEPATP